MPDQIASLYAKIGADPADFNKAMRGVKDDLTSSQKGFATFGNVAAGAFKAVSIAAVAMGAALVAGIGKAIGAAADMEQGIADIGAVMSLTAGETEQLGGLIKDLGLDPTLKVSATQAAEAIHNLGTAGLSMSQIMGGAAESTVRLANATNDDFGLAASIVTDVMAQFNMEASELDHVVNQVAGTTVASKFDINDFGLAIAQAGGVAGAVGVDFEDFTATIAATSSSFASGSDAGTSFKTFLQRLVPTTSDAKEALIQLGLSTGEDVVTAFFTAEGAMRPMEEIAGNLQVAFQDLSEAQKIEAATTIFGQDAWRTALALAKGGTPIIQEMKAAIGKVDAEEMGAKRMDTFAGAIEIARGVMETLSISIGQAFLPILRPMVEQFTALAQKHGPAVIKFFEGLATGIGENIQKGMEWTQNVLLPMWERLTQVGIAVWKVAQQVGDAIRPVADAIGEWVSWKDILLAVGVLLTGAVLVAIGGFIAAMAPVILLVAKVTAVIAILREAWEHNFMGIRDITNTILNNISKWLDTHTGLWKGDWGKTIDFMVNHAGEAWNEIWREVVHVFSRIKQEVMHIVNTWLATTEQKIENWVGVTRSQLHIWYGWVVRWFNEAMTVIKDWFRDAFAWFKPTEWVTKGKAIIQGLWDGAKEIWQGFKDWWSRLWSTLTGTVDVKLKIGSPSKEMMERGKAAVEGFAIGAQQAMPMATGAMGSLAGVGLGAASSQPAVSTSRIEELLLLILQETRSKQMNVTVQGGGGSDPSGLVSFRAGLRG